MPELAGPGSSGVAEPWGGGWETVGRGGAGAEDRAAFGSAWSLKERPGQGRGGLWRDSLRGCGNMSSQA